MALELGINVGFVAVAPTADPATGSSVAIDNSAKVVKHTSPAVSGRITEVGWWAGTATEEANFEVGLYAADGGTVPGEAGTLLEVSRTNAKGTTDGWKVVSGLNWTISKSTDYWIGVQLDDTTTTTFIDNSTSGGAGIDTLTSQTTLNNPFSGGAISDVDGMYAIYAVVEAVPIIDKVSGTDAGFANTTDGADTDPFDSGDKADYDVQVGDTLDNSTTYYWRVRGLDPTPGSNTYGDWATTRSFTTEATNQPPTVALNTPADSATGVSTTPTLEFTGTDPGGDDVRYNVQVATHSDFPAGGTMDSYSESNQGTTRQLNNILDAAAQSFTGNGYPINELKFYIKKNGLPTGVVTAKIYEHSGTFGSSGVPTGAALASSTTTIDITTISTSYSLVSFSFNNFETVNGTKYIASIEFSNGNASNLLDCGMDTTAPTHGGNLSERTKGTGTWTAQATWDLCFYVIYADTTVLNVTSGTDAGFANTTDGADTDPFDSGDKADYDVQAGDTLTALTTYYWRVRGIDPTPGSNTYGDWSATRSFTTVSGAASSIKKLSSISQANLKKISGITNANTKKVSEITNV
jgi:hypothetical protein